MRQILSQYSIQEIWHNKCQKVLLFVLRKIHINGDLFREKIHDRKRFKTNNSKTYNDFLITFSKQYDFSKFSKSTLSSINFVFRIHAQGVPIRFKALISFANNDCLAFKSSFGD